MLPPDFSNEPTNSWVNLTIPDISGLSNLSRTVFLDTKAGLARYPLEGRYHGGLGDYLNLTTCLKHWSDGLLL